MKKRFGLAPRDLAVWAGSCTVITASFLLFGGEGLLSFAASLIGASSLILCAKGLPAGQALMIAFSLLYGVISYSCAYYGEMITYLGMTAPMAAASLISWIKHPYAEKGGEVEVGRVSAGAALLTALSTAAVTLLFYFVLKVFGTARLPLSTLSVTTSFEAVCLTYLRSEYFALAYALNDIVLLGLWIPAAAQEQRYVPTAVCFGIFLVNDLYGFLNWKKMKRRQR